MRAFADSVTQSGFTDVVLLGMGGSSLAPEVLRQVLCSPDRNPRFRVLDSVDPDAVRAAMARAKNTLFVLASKSGSTIEPNVMAEEAKRRVIAEGHGDWAKRFIAITDQDTALHRRAVSEGFRDVFVNPSDIGGRYSALSLFGMVPAALMGLDVDGLLARARVMEQACRVDRARENPGLALGALMGAGALSGRDKLTLWVPPQLQSLGLWVEQLVAESTGKHGKGVVPITGEPTDLELGDDRVVVGLSVGAQKAPGLHRLEVEDVPHASLEMPDLVSLGAEFLRWEVATATAGLLLDINPFDEPNVQQAKDATRGLLDRYQQQHQLPFPEAHGSSSGARLTLTEPAVEALGGSSADAFLQVAKAGRLRRPSRLPAVGRSSSGKTRCRRFVRRSQRGLPKPLQWGSALDISIPPASFTKVARRTACSSSSRPTPTEDLAIPEATVFVWCAGDSAGARRLPVARSYRTTGVARAAANAMSIVRTVRAERVREAVGRSAVAVTVLSRKDYRATRATIAVTLSVAPLFIADRTTFCATSSTAF